MEYQTIAVSSADGVARVTLARPDVRNAFNAQTIAELSAAFAELDGRSDIRAIVLAGQGKAFCGGADVNWMRASLELTREQNVADAKAMSAMFRTIDRCSKPVVARIQGAALGGGCGLAAVCDIVVAAVDAVFGFTETKLGILPAVISPFVLAKIGATNARALFLTGERFDARRARRIGLVHAVVATVELDTEVERVLAELHGASPAAVAVAKRLIVDVGNAEYDATLDLTAEAIAAQRTSEEGQEGLRAFLERRPASWTK
ncbi:MAG TPA: enoyl-CoA hydratase-related protein [Candidatus Baltobacteraceae bacterium]